MPFFGLFQRLYQLKQYIGIAVGHHKEFLLKPPATKDLGHHPALLA
jgi:hypothetical protein